MREKRMRKIAKILVAVIMVLAICQISSTKVFATEEEDAIKAVQNAGNTIGSSAVGGVNQTSSNSQNTGTSTGTSTTTNKSLNKSESKGIKDVLAAATSWINGAETTSNTGVDDFVNQFVGIGQILVIAGIVVLLITIGITGIKWITATPDKQAKLKEQLIGLVIATVVIFGAVGIWNIVRGIMGKVENDYLTTANQQVVVLAENEVK